MSGSSQGGKYEWKVRLERSGGCRGFSIGVVIPDPGAFLPLSVKLAVAGMQVIAGSVITSTTHARHALDAGCPLAPQLLVNQQRPWG